MKSKRVRFLLAGGLSLLLGLASSGCGGSHSPGAVGRGLAPTGRAVGAGSKPALPTDGTAPRAGFEPAPTNLADVLAQIDAYPIPNGVSPDRWAALTSALKQLLIERERRGEAVPRPRATHRVAPTIERSVAAGKTFSSAPTGTNNAVSDLAALSDPAGTQATVTWIEKLWGDCSNDGQVDIADLQPIAAHYGETSTGPGSPAYLADANGDGTVDIADLQPIAADYSMHLQGYLVWRGHWNGTSVDWEATPRPNPNVANPSWSADRPTTVPANARPGYTYTDDLSAVTDKANVRYKVTAYGDGASGVDSNVAVMPPPGPPPTYNVSGTVSQGSTGVGAVTLTLTPGGLSSSTTPPSGGYTISGVANGTYTLTPSRAGYVFNPAFRTVTVAGADVTGQDFMASPSGLAVTPWPEFGHDQWNTGQSAYVGAQTGTLKWSAPVGTAGKIVESSASIGADGTIYIGNDDWSLYALNPIDGSVKWSHATTYPITGSPAIGADGTVFVGSMDDNLYAFDPATGAFKWQFATGGYITASPAIGSDGTVYIGSQDHYLYAVDPVSGIQKWSFATGSFAVSTPAIASDGTIYVGSDYLYALNPLDGSQKWKALVDGAVPGGPAVGPTGTIYAGANDNRVYAVSPGDGSIIWSYSGSSPFQALPAIAVDGTIYIGSIDKKVYALNPDGTLKWSFGTGAQIQSAPTIGADGIVYVTSNDANVYALRPADGSVLWTYTTPTIIRSSPTIAADGTIYVGCLDGNLYAIGP